MNATLNGTSWSLSGKATIHQVPNTNEFQLRISGGDSRILINNTSYELDLIVNAPAFSGTYPLIDYSASLATRNTAGVRLNGLRQNVSFYSEGNNGSLELKQYKDYYGKGDLYIRGDYHFEATVPNAGSPAGQEKIQVTNGQFFVPVDTTTADYRAWKKMN
ncbi:hypothetical protein GU926_05155 [Nibribacter ruber]|uniref:Uncharacterized protein n=1 Tax=Nibribacter ruber TaxID=2698458 RepID=A0A6P1NT16_9BACT|nr:hypothetical protein [Nibribacter ruber]QHL86857.1 hypothetical protein GU926_05155 [Nibribacter ruber]